MEDRNNILSRALLLKPQERFLLIDDLIQSLDEQDEKLKSLWIEEAEKRLKAHREGKTKGIEYEEVFGENT